MSSGCKLLWIFRVSRMPSRVISGCQSVTKPVRNLPNRPLIGKLHDFYNRLLESQLMALVSVMISELHPWSMSMYKWCADAAVMRAFLARVVHHVFINCA